MKKIVLCGGGTGGHIYPSIAVADVLKQEGRDLFYVGVKGKPEELVAEKAGIEFYGYEFSGFPRKLQKELFIWPFNLLRAVSKAKVYLKHFKPDIVFGTGGYSAAPVFIAARRLNIPYIVHNLDVRFGLANKFCASGATLLTCGFETSDDFVKNLKVVTTGNPVRKEFLEIEKLDKNLLYKEFNFDPRKKTIFVIGGSQGANAINDLIIEILKDLVLTNDFQIIHQVGEQSYETYTKRIPARVLETTNYITKPFFENPEKCYFISDLVISRSGAMTTTEITILGKAAIFVPYPYAGNHQEANALHLVNAGGVLLLKQKGLSSRTLLNTILEVINNSDKLFSMSKITSSFARPNATRDIADLILKTIETKHRSKENLTPVI